MAVILASHGCYCPSVEMINRGRMMDNFDLSSSISNHSVLLLSGRKAHIRPMIKQNFRLQVKVQQTESPETAGINRQTVKSRKPKRSSVNNHAVNSKPSAVLSDNRQANSRVSINGQVAKMVPAGELSGHKSLADDVKKVNSSKQVVNGSQERRYASPDIVKIPGSNVSKGVPPAEELKVLQSDQGFSWADENCNYWRRTLDVWLFVISLQFRVFLDNAKWTYMGKFSEDEQKKRRQRTASWLRECVLQLGPTFIKLGQQFSTRSDLFPQELVDELAKLQDRVPAVSPERARNLIETQLGAPVNLIFKEFEDRPIAAASLGQVHRAILHNREEVVVKVQRSGLKKLFDIDFRNLKLIAEYFQKTETLGGPKRDWISVYDECKKTLYQEIDYVNEAKNADRFQRDFRNIKWIRVPLVYWDYTATKVLTMEYVPGIKINNVEMLDARKYSRSRIASRAIEAYLIQVLTNGFFHADPHPGNIAIDENEALVYYDFGMMGEIKSFTRERLLELFYAVYEKDTKKVIENLIDLGALQRTGDLSSVKRYVQFVLDNLLLQRLDEQQTFSKIGEDLFVIAQDQSVLFPSTLTFVLRAFSTLEGIGQILDPDFSFARIAVPYAQELLDIRQKQQTGTQLAEEIRKQANDARSYVLSMPYRVQRIEEIVKKLESGDLKLLVQVLESERAAQKATILQLATTYTVLGGTLLNLGAAFCDKGEVIANGSFIAAGLFFSLFAGSMQMVKQLDKFEEMM